MDLFTEITGHIFCKECGASIPYDRRYIEENCCYQVSDYTNCLCPDCSAKLRESQKSSQPRKLWKGCATDFPMDTDGIIKDIMEITEQLRPDMWGIRSIKSGKFLTIGLIGDRILFCDSPCMAQAYLWNRKEDVDKVFLMLSELGKNLKFKETHKVDEASEEEKTAWLNPFAP